MHCKKWCGLTCRGLQVQANFTAQGTDQLTTADNRNGPFVYQRSNVNGRQFLTTQPSLSQGKRTHTISGREPDTLTAKRNQSTICCPNGDPAHPKPLRLIVLRLSTAIRRKCGIRGRHTPQHRLRLQRSARSHGAVHGTVRRLHRARTEACTGGAQCISNECHGARR